MRLKWLFALLCLLSGCSTTREFTPMDNCRLPPQTKLSCTDGTAFLAEIVDPADYVCFKIQDMKRHEEECRK